MEIYIIAGVSLSLPPLLLIHLYLHAIYVRQIILFKKYYCVIL